LIAFFFRNYATMPKMTKFNQILDEDEILVTFCIIDDVKKAVGV